MAKEVVMMEYRRKIAVVYTLQDALEKIEQMKQHGFREFEIHLFAKDITAFTELKTTTKLNIRQCGHLLDQLQGLFFNMALYEVCLRNFDFSKEELQHYGRMIEKGACVIIAQHELPYEKTPARSTVAVKVNIPIR